MGKSPDRRTLRWRNLPDAWMDWRDGTLNLRESLFMLGVLKGKPAKVVTRPQTDVDRETMLCTIRLRYDTARRLTDLAEQLNEPGPLALAGRLLDESMIYTWYPRTPEEYGERLLEAHGRIEYKTNVWSTGGWSASVTAG